ncbi:hypothetical protein D9615_009208 [Tricholomella constricta]|uniref:Uncharacterized protein n=1 Tax=Tricholomella constricta TaxID=117010 RepID=A0A8H5H2L5_9AGAR|nr:hypothetical protein D9615_009208 [Tricholomella constricta]
MGNGSPTAYLLWAILACIYLVFLLMHLWNYDRFQCLRWDSGRQPGAFKRVMTYSYLATVPLLVIFSVAITVIKFKQGFILAPNGMIIPRPFSLWDPANRRWVLPLYFVLSIAWSLEQYVRVSSPFPAASPSPSALPISKAKLTFWVFLLNQGPGKREWFASWEFRVWTIAGSPRIIITQPLMPIHLCNLCTCFSIFRLAINTDPDSDLFYRVIFISLPGSVATLTGMPMTVLSTRHDIDTCLAYIFLVGSAAGTTTTLCFHYVLARFPWFIRHVKSEGAEPDVVVRLATFYQLNRIRVLFRYLFTLPLMIIAIDGLAAPYHIVGDPFALDFLLMMGGIGCFISSAITLLVFFPRSITQESGYHTKAHSHSLQNTHSTKTPPPTSAVVNPYYNHHNNHNHNPLHPLHDLHHRHNHSQDPDLDEDVDQERYFHTSSSTTRTPTQQEMRMGAFRFPDGGDGRASQSSSRLHGSELDEEYAYTYTCESGVSPGYGNGNGYESDVDADADVDGEGEGGEGEGEENASVAGPSSCSRLTLPDPAREREREVLQRGHAPSSDDTVWDRVGAGAGVREARWGGGGRRAGTAEEAGTGEVARGKRRRHSDGPFFFDARGQLVSPGAGGARVGIGFGIGIGRGSGSGRGRGREGEKERGRDRDRDRSREKDKERERERDRERSRQRRKEQEEARVRMLEESTLHPYVLSPSG